MNFKNCLDYFIISIIGLIVVFSSVINQGCAEPGDCIKGVGDDEQKISFNTQNLTLLVQRNSICKAVDNDDWDIEYEVYETNKDGIKISNQSISKRMFPNAKISGDFFLFANPNERPSSGFVLIEGTLTKSNCSCCCLGHEKHHCGSTAFNCSKTSGICNSGKPVVKFSEPFVALFDEECKKFYKQVISNFSMEKCKCDCTMPEKECN